MNLLKVRRCVGLFGKSWTKISQPFVSIKRMSVNIKIKKHQIKLTCWKIITTTYCWFHHRWPVLTYLPCCSVLFLKYKPLMTLSQDNDEHSDELGKEASHQPITHCSQKILLRKWSMINQLNGFCLFPNGNK